MSALEKSTTPDSDAGDKDATSKRAKLEADVAKSANRVMKHMNDDHEDSLVAYVLAFATEVEGAVDKEDALLKNVLRGKLLIRSVKITTVDADGFLLEVRVVDKDADIASGDAMVLSNVRVPYHEPITEARQLHHTAVAMHRKAYDKLGIFYKAKHGYYQQVFKMIASVSYSKAKKMAPKTSVVAGAAALTAAVAAAGYLHHKRRTVP